MYPVQSIWHLDTLYPDCGSRGWETPGSAWDSVGVRRLPWTMCEFFKEYLDAARVKFVAEVLVATYSAWCVQLECGALSGYSHGHDQPFVMPASPTTLPLSPLCSSLILT